MVFILVVTSSPWYPSPLVTALNNFPFSYVKLIDAPSYLSSQVYAISPSTNFLIRVSQSSKSSLEYELDKEYIL